MAALFNSKDYYSVDSLSDRFKMFVNRQRSSSIVVKCASKLNHMEQGRWIKNL